MLTLQEKDFYKQTADNLKGFDRRQFIAGAIKLFSESGLNGVAYARREFGWAPHMIKKAMGELKTGIRCLDSYSLRGRKPAEAHLPHLENDIKEIAERYSQTDYTFNTSQLYTRMSAPSIRKLLIEEKGYDEHALPSVRCILNKLNAYGFKLRTVSKNKPKKK